MSSVELKVKGNRENFDDAKTLDRVQDFVLEGFSVEVQTDDTPEAYHFRELLFLHSEDLGNFHTVERKPMDKYQSITKNTCAYTFYCF